MSDLISRQAVLKLLSTMPPEDAMTKAMLIQSVKQMDATQPEKRTNERTETRACDLIDRQAAIDALHMHLMYRMGTDSNKKRLDEWINNLPSAQPERMRGTWIIKDNPGTGWYRVTCSECGEDVTSTAPCIGFYPNAKVTWDYCPNCGADMREVDDERV